MEAYETMMDPDAAKPVRFTYDSDREIVRFIFYRVCFGMLHSFLPDVGQGRPRRRAAIKRAGGGGGEDAGGYR